MIRRTTAVLLALIMLISVFPVVASADDTVYYVNDNLWVKGIGNEPTAVAIGGYWEPVLDAAGNQVKRPGCNKEIHKHSPMEGCWDAIEGLICTKEEHTQQTHSMICSFLESEYLWVVKAYEPDPTLPEGGSGTGGGITPGGSGDGENRGAVYFGIHNTDDVGNPLTGVSFILFEYVTDEETGEKQRAYVYNSDIELNLGTEEEPLTEEELKELEELDYQCSPVTTNADGRAYFNELERYIEESANSVTWYLAQESSAFLENGPYYDVYTPYTQVWKVDITRTGLDTFDLSIVPDPEQQSYFGGTGSYDAATRTLTCMNGRTLCTLDINMKFDGFEEGDTADNLEAKARVTVTGPDGYETTVEFPADNELGYPWQATLKGLNPGTYTITADDDVAQIPGYTLEETSYRLLSNGEELGGQSVTLSQDAVLGTATITHRYSPIVEETEPPVEPAGPSNTILVSSKDNSGNKLAGAKYLLSGAGISRVLEGETEIYLDDLEQYAVEGKTITCTLEQTKAPAGYNLSDDEFEIAIDVTNGEITVTLKKRQNLLERLFNQNGVEIGPDGAQLATFINTRRTNAQVQLTCDVEVKVASSCWDYNNTVKEFENKKHKFVLSWTDEKGKDQKEYLTLASGETKTFAKSLPFGAEYTIDCAEGHNHECNLPMEGTITASLTEKMAEIKYDVQRGNTLDLYMLKVDSQTKEKLAGAKFSLKDANGEELRVYTTKTDGKIDIEGIFVEPGRFTLKETQAPDEYDKLRTPIEIEIVPTYEAKNVNGGTVLRQNLGAEISHKSVQKQSDGSYYIKNALTSGNPQTGDHSDIQFWAGMMAVSMIGLAEVSAGMLKKKRRAK